MHSDAREQQRITGCQAGWYAVGLSQAAGPIKYCVFEMQRQMQACPHSRASSPSNQQLGISNLEAARQRQLCTPWPMALNLLNGVHLLATPTNKCCHRTSTEPE